MIDTDLPVKMVNGDRVRIIDKVAGYDFCIVGVWCHQPPGSINPVYSTIAWNTVGECSDGDPRHAIKNQPGFKMIKVYLNVYEDGTTGYGYQNRELADKYANYDSRIPVIDQKEVRLIVRNDSEQGQSQ